MEEKKNTPKKLSYEELNRAAGDLYHQNQQLIARMKQMEEALADSEFNRMSFLISMLFKVVEHSEMYKPEFVAWSVDTIEQSLAGFAAGMEKPEQDNPETTATDDETK